MTCRGEPEVLTLVTVGYNRKDLLTWQCHLLHRWIAGPFNHIILDNSNEGFLMQDEELCRLAEVVRVESRNDVNPSISHATAVDWWISQGMPPGIVGFLDHDIFPFAPFDADEFVGEAPAAGLLQVKPGGRYLWPGFVFVRTEEVEAWTTKPEQGFDTAVGRQWSDALMARSKKVETRLYRVADGGVQTSAVQVVAGTWLHAVAMSGWAGNNDLKERLVRRIINAATVGVLREDGGVLRCGEEVFPAY